MTNGRFLIKKFGRRKFYRGKFHLPRLCHSEISPRIKYRSAEILLIRPMKFATRELAADHYLLVMLISIIKVHLCSISLNYWPGSPDIICLSMTKCMFINLKHILKNKYCWSCKNFLVGQYYKHSAAKIFVHDFYLEA